MKKLMGIAMLAGATIAGAGAANAEVSGSVTFTTDYLFRGISQTSGNPAVQGSLDYTQDMFYAGIWGSNVDFGSCCGETVEVDGYVGITPTTGPVNWDLSLVGYFYPGADGSANLDYYEGIIGAKLPLNDQFSVGAQFAYTPEYAGNLGKGTYWELNGSYAPSENLSFTAAYGTQDVDDLGDSYSTWNIGGTYAMHGFTFGLMYSDTQDAFENGYTGDESNADGSLVFSVGRSL
jgi:uncharacterized protein (TIGR02001 family)